MAQEQLIIDVKARLQQAQSQINKATASLKKMGRATDKTTDKMHKMNSVGKILKRTMGGIALLFAGRAFLKVAVDFEILRVKLETFTGSQRKASEVWERLNKIAATTQVDVDKLIDSYTQLRSVGIDPTNEELQRLADLAAATGLEFSQLSNIIFRGTSSTELFYNAGITARVEGEKLRVTYMGVTEVIERTSGAIKDYLVELTKTQGYVGASQKLAEGIGGAMSNITGNFKALVEQIGKTGGAIDGLAGVINKVANYFAKLREKIVATNSIWYAMNDGLKIATVSIAAFFAVLIGVKVIKGLGLLKVALWNVNKAILANPMVAIGVLIAAAVVAMVAAMVYYRESVSKFIGGAAAYIYEKMLNIKSIFEYLMPGALETLGNAFGKAWDWIGEKVSAAADWVIAKTQKLVEAFGGAVDWIKDKAKELGLSLDISINIDETLQEMFDADKIKAQEWGASVTKAVNGTLKTVEDFAIKTKSVLSNLWEGTDQRDETDDRFDVNRQTQNEETLNTMQALEAEKTRILEEAEKKRSDIVSLYGFLNIQKQKDWSTATTNDKAKGLREQLGVLATHSKKAFDIQKAVSIAEALVNTYTGATAALKAGPFIGPILAALTVASGLASVASIRSQKFSGRQGGGPVQAGVTYNVGENGAEKFTAPSDGNIEPNEIDGGSDSSTPTSVNVNVQVGPGAPAATVGDSVANEFLEIMNNGGIDIGGNNVFPRHRPQ